MLTIVTGVAIAVMGIVAASVKCVEDSRPGDPGPRDFLHRVRPVGWRIIVILVALTAANIYLANRDQAKVASSIERLSGVADTIKTSVGELGRATASIQGRVENSVDLTAKNAEKTDVLLTQVESERRAMLLLDKGRYIAEQRMELISNAVGVVRAALLEAMATVELQITLNPKKEELATTIERATKQVEGTVNDFLNGPVTRDDKRTQDSKNLILVQGSLTTLIDLASLLKVALVQADAEMVRNYIQALRGRLSALDSEVQLIAVEERAKICGQQQLALNELIHKLTPVHGQCGAASKTDHD